MSLMKTLAKVAIGVAIAKGAGAMMNKGSGQSQASSGGLGGLLGGLTGGGAASGGLGGMLGGLSGGSAAGSTGGGLQDMLGGLMGGAQAGTQGSTQGGMSGGLGGLLESLGGGGSTGASTGGLGGLLGGLAGAAGAGGLMGAAMKQRPADNNESFGSVLNSAFDANPEPAIEPTADQEAAAGLMLRAMIQAAKSDGTLDDAEREKLIGQLGDDVDSNEAAFVQSELQSPVDVDGLVAQVPKGMEQQIYAVSVMAINLDSQDEAKYLHQLAQGLGLNAAAVNNVHAQMGVPSLYT
ncbi:DUF533 domain-containing protein [Pseudosulfitobacter sp. SM2401]|uniref:tellurite resistance TerB family protein n=1 Tax=Pseudosulfitobacter sp. SM2401 TaxID=3350098 RepID=UPI0036F39334